MNDELMHFGILGMKWGVRRYQKEDGTRTKLGKEHRAELEENNEKEDKKKDRDQELLDAFDEADRESISRLKQYSDDILDPTDSDSERAKEAAKLGLQALKNIGEDRIGADPNDETYQSWFLIEDQTVGLPQIADFANKGWSAEKIKSEIGNIDDLASSTYEYGNKKLLEYGINTNKLYSIQEAAYAGYDDYIDECVRLKGEETKHSDASSDELMHYGILGMKWGIRRFQKENGSLTKAGRERYGVGDGDGNNAKSGPKSNPNAGTSSEAESKPKARPASEMSDEELRAALNRLDMERRYNELTNPIRNDQRNNVDDRDYTMLPRSVTNVSNADLDAYIKRIRLEQEYSKLTAPPPKELTAGQKFMKDFAGPILITVAKEYFTKKLKQAVGLEGNNNNNNNNNNNDNGNDKLNKRLNNIENSINSLRNNQNGGGKQSKEEKRQEKEAKRQEKDMDKRFDELKAMISDGIKSNLPVPADNSGSPSTVKSPTPVRPTFRERQKTLLGATSQAMQRSRENQRYREQLISDLAKQRKQREEQQRREQRNEYNRAARQDRVDSFLSKFTSSKTSLDNLERLRVQREEQRADRERREQRREYNRAAFQDRIDSFIRSQVNF